MAIEAKTFWLRRARAMVWRHGIARWLELFLPAAAVVCGAGAVALLVQRGVGAQVSPIYIWIGVGLALAAGGAAWLSRRRALSLPQALVRLEDEGRLHTRLSAARAGVGEWPMPAKVGDPARWDWRGLLAPAIVAALLLAGARWVPLPADVKRQAPQEQPIAWSQVESWLETLQQSQLVEPEALEKIEARLNELRNQPPEKWYSQSSLEAGDSLKQETEAALRGLQRDLSEAERLAAAMEKQGQAGAKDELKKMGGAWQQALQGLGGGELPVNKDLLKQAKDLDPGKMAQLSPEELAEMRQRLQEGTKVCDQCVGPKLKETPGGERAQRPGGEGGGGETAPLSLKKKPTDLKTGQTETLDGNDLTRALPAETVAVTAGEHEVDKSAPRAQTGGEIASPGQGGAAVWRESMIPREREVLQRYFK